MRKKIPHFSSLNGNFSSIEYIYFLKSLNKPKIRRILVEIFRQGALWPLT